MKNRLDWIFMILGIVTAIGSTIVAIQTDKPYAWPAITAMWIAACMSKQVTIEEYENKKKP